MYFVTIRLIFWSLVFIACFLLIRKSVIVNKRKWYTIVFTIIIVLTAVSATIPFENTFLTFSSPESAFSYSSNSTLKLIVNGEKSDFAVGVKDDKYVYTIIPKSDNGWKSGVGFNSKRVIQTTDDGISICVYQYKNSSDYYVTILDTNGGPSEISDNSNSKFYHLEKASAELNRTFYTYYACISDFNSKYTITVNDEIIRFKN